MKIRYKYNASFLFSPYCSFTYGTVAIFTTIADYSSTRRVTVFRTKQITASGYISLWRNVSIDNYILQYRASFRIET